MKRILNGEILSVHRSWPVALGLAIGATGFVLGAIGNPGALAPMWGRSSWNWIVVLALLALAAALVQRAMRRPALFAVALGSVLVAATFGFGAFVAVALLLIASDALGSRILEWAEGAPSPTPTAQFSFAGTVGLAALSLLLGFVAHLPINTPVTYLALAAVAIWLGQRHLLARGRALIAVAPLGRQRDTPLLVRGALWFAFGMQICFAALPERYFDALAMHLAIARELEVSGVWHFDAREIAWAVAPMGANWLFGWVYVLAGEYAAKLLNAAFLLLIGGLIVESGVVPRRLGLLAALILGLTPITFVVTSSVFVDNGLALFVTAAILFAARISDLRSRAAVAGFAIASAGAMAVKPHGLIAFAAASAALLAMGGWQQVYRTGTRTMLVCAAAAMGAAWPYAWAWIATGNPVFPYFNGFFKSPLFLDVNFVNVLYPGGILPSDFYELAFAASKYYEGNDGAIGFAMTLLLPAGMLLAAVAGSKRIRVVALSSLIYALMVLLNTRYLRYVYPAFPLFALVMVYPLAETDALRLRVFQIAIVIAAIVLAVFRIPAAGWILSTFDPKIAFSPKAKERVVDAHAPLRKLGRIQAALGSSDSRIVVFGQNIGADIKGRPLYVSWYFPNLEARVLFEINTAETAANTLAAMDASYIIFDRRAPKPEWVPWEDAARQYGRLIAVTNGGALYEFHPDAVPGHSVLPQAAMPWEGWAVDPAQANPPSGEDLNLPPGAVVSRALDAESVPLDAELTLSVEHVCDAPTSIREQMNWLREDGTIIRTDATQSACTDTATRGSLRTKRPKGAQTVYFYFANDGGASARLSHERASILSRP